MRLARVWSFCRLCQRAAAPLSKSNGSASATGSLLLETGDCALTGADRNINGSVNRIAPSTMAASFLDCDVMLLFSLSPLLFLTNGFLRSQRVLSTKMPKRFGIHRLLHYGYAYVF